ncbi:preprotein translocase subunit SecY [archaeon]|jgi:preprotein translocase subunit SecY|nr:preprotein translocase subunit SecY [archaeon]MBT4242109.1 preprotein translocase subunit SecY [archaeon]MBT4417797.1 preprotein translocase subunit SecY [archaeon]
MDFRVILKNLPEVRSPTEKKLSFNVKLKWTLIVLIAFFVMSNISLYGLSNNALERFEYLAVIMGTSFGSIISLGIGPIVMASIILQLLVGSQILEIDTSTVEGKKFFSGLQKLLVFFFIIFEAVIYVYMQGLQPVPGFAGILIFQLILGGLVIVFMNELSEKWGFGSGVSLFIAAGVSWRLVSASFSFLDTEGRFHAAGAVVSLVYHLINSGEPGAGQGVMLALAAILATVILFLIVVWAQSLKIEIPLSYDRLRGYSMKWPLQFFYASVIPVILTAALISNIQLFGGLLQNWLGHPTFLGNIVNGVPVSGFLFWVGSTNIPERIIQGNWEWVLIGQTLGHIIFYMFFAALFSVFWVKTSGMDAAAQANNILKSGLQIPGFRKDKRILESILARYVMPLTIMGGMAIGLLAALADVLGALVGGTALLLGIMIIFQFYQNIAQQHAMDMNPALKKMMGA